MGSRLGSPLKKSRWLSVRGIAKIALAVFAFLYFFRSSLSPFAYRARRNDHGPNLPKSPIPSGLSFSSLERFQDLTSHLEGSGEEDRKKLEEEEQKHKEEEKKKLEEQQRKKQEEEQKKRKQEEEEEEKKRKQEEENKKKEEEEEKRLQDDENKKQETQTEEKPKEASKDAQTPNKLTTTIVAVRMKSEEDTVKWMDEVLTDITHKRIYVADDLNAELHLNQNKGRESMAYIKYILDFYDNLDDVTIFSHASRIAWHNNALHSRDAAIMFNNLQRSWIVEQGYMNARCELYPGCPQWIKWNATRYEVSLHPERLPDIFDSTLWDQIFPDRSSNPVFLSQPCCSQFAASKDTIRSVPKERYQKLHDWLGTTETDDAIAGRVMEYMWQYLFLGKDEHCPDMLECYCKGYGLCLTDQSHQRDLIRYNRMRSEIDDTMEKMDQWDKSRGCHDIPDEREEEKQACKKDNPWETPLFQVRAEKMTLEREMPKRFGVTVP